MSIASLPSFRRPVFGTILGRAEEPRGVMQVLAGPRQAGKTTVIRQVLEHAGLPNHYATADEGDLTVYASPLRDIIRSRLAAGDDRQLPALEAALELERAP